MRVGEVAFEHRVSSKIPEVAPDERNAVKAVCHLPNLLIVTVVVQQHRSFGRIRCDVGLYPLSRPVFPLVVEKPSHLEPHGILVSTHQ